MAIEPEFVRLIKQRWIRPMTKTSSTNNVEEKQMTVPSPSRIKPMQLDDDEEDLR